MHLKEDLRLDLLTAGFTTIPVSAVQFGSNIKPFTKKEKIFINETKIVSELQQAMSATY